MLSVRGRHEGIFVFVLSVCVVVSLNMLFSCVCASLWEFALLSVCCWHALLDYMYVCVCIYSIIGCECVPAHTDNMLTNVYEETACEIQGGQC